MNFAHREPNEMPQPVSARLKIGLSACFSHADPARSLFTNKTLQYVEQSIAHWLMSAGAMVVMVPCPRARPRAATPSCRTTPSGSMAW